MMHLYLLRHGEAEPIAASDSERPLTERGRTQVYQASNALPDIELMAVSPYLRAQQSADIVESRVLIKNRTETETLTPDNPATDVLNWLQTVDAETVLLVGHNPLISQLCNWLAGQSSIQFSTGNLAHLRGEIPAPDAMELVWLK